MIHRETGRLIAALAFFTRLPLHKLQHFGDGRSEALSRAAHWFPVAGLLLAIPSAVLFWAVARFAMTELAAGLAIALGMWCTRALHEDGLADCADALGATADRDRALEIMRDSRIGVYGASALVFSIGFRWVALAAMTPLAGAIAVLVAHSTGRAAICHALALSTYARRQGTASIVAQGISRRDWILILLIALLIAAALGSWPGMAAAAVGLFAAYLFLRVFASRIGGYTGDALGGMEQIAEITVLLSLAAIPVAP